MHLTRHIKDDSYLEITDSQTFCVFGNDTMSKPGPRSGIERREFRVLKNEDIESRKSEVCFNQCMT